MCEIPQRESFMESRPSRCLPPLRSLHPKLYPQARLAGGIEQIAQMGNNCSVQRFCVLFLVNWMLNSKGDVGRSVVMCCILSNVRPVGVAYVQ